MAVGPTESLNSGAMQMDPRNVALTTRAIQIMMALMRATSTVTVNPSASLVPNAVANIQDTGVGLLVDFSA